MKRNSVRNAHTYAKFYAFYFPGEIMKIVSHLRSKGSNTNDVGLWTKKNKDLEKGHYKQDKLECTLNGPAEFVTIKWGTVGKLRHQFVK